MNYVFKASILTKNILKNSPGKCKKNGFSHCKNENPLCNNILSEKNLLLIGEGKGSKTERFLDVIYEFPLKWSFYRVYKAKNIFFQ